MNFVEIGARRKQPQGFQAFIPHSFPPKEGFGFSPKILAKCERATRLLGKLDGSTKHIPNIDFFLLMYVLKDAASSSQIEGTQATMVDAIAAGVMTNADIPADVDDILHYIEAINYGMARMTKDNFPLTLRFIRELHQKLMHKGRSTHFSDPGEFRKSQNWIGGTRPDNARFVPPPVIEMNVALGELENFWHIENEMPTIIKAGLIHAQFETIHPFLDGNGRTGRMLITFYMWKEGFLKYPVLFLSAYFKKYQEAYYERLSDYHNGRVAAWIDFFLDGVIEIAQEAIDTMDRITELRQKDMGKVQMLGKRSAESAVPLLSKLYKQPIVNNSLIQEWTGFTRRGAQIIIDRFINLEILSPKNEDKKYGQSYAYIQYINIFIG